MKRKIIENGYQIRAKAQSQDTHQIFMYGTIGHEINIQKLWADLQGLPESVATLEFFVDSDGGYVQDGYTLLSNLDRLKQKYNTVGHIDGQAASMASAFVVNMDKTVASPTSKMIIHDPWMFLDIYGGFNAKALEKLIEDIQDLHAQVDADSDIMASVYAKKTGLSVAEVKEKWMADGKDHHFTPEQMLAAGLVDEIAVADYVEPPKTKEVDEDDWLTSLMQHGRKAATNLQPEKLMYRGPHEKLLARFALNSENEYNLKGETPANDTPVKQTQGNMKFQTIAKTLGLDPSVDEATVVSKIERIQSNLADAEAEKTRMQGLIDEYKTTQASNEERIATLEADLRTAKSGTVVDSIIAKATENEQGKTVNKNIHGKLGELAVEKMEAEADGKESMANTLEEHMLLLAKNNLIPIGKNPDITDDGTSARDDSPGGSVNREALEKAKAKGAAARERMYKKRKTA